MGINYWFFTLWGYEIYVDIKNNRPFTLGLHRDKSNGDVSIWFWGLFITSSRGKPT